jgi:hypothetical protein
VLCLGRGTLPRHFAVTTPASKLNYQCMKSHKRMRIGIGMPTIQRIKLRPMILLLLCFEFPGLACLTTPHRSD